MNNNPNGPDVRSEAIFAFLVIGFFISLIMFGAYRAKAEPILQSVEPATLCFPGASVRPRRATCDQQWHGRHLDEVYKMQHAVLTRLTMRIDSDGNPVYAPSCARDSFGCEQRIRSLVEIIAHESAVAKVDPWIVVSMIWHESRFNPFAESPLGTRGIMQLHPRNSRFSDNQFLHQDWYWNRCKRVLGNCQEEVVRDGVTLLHDAMSRCDGSVVQGLTMYNTGRCTARGNRYAELALRYRASFLDVLLEQ